MKYIAPMLFALLVIAGFTIGTWPHPARQDHVYGVTEVRAGLTNRPVAWRGRTVLVQGTFTGYTLVNAKLPFAAKWYMATRIPRVYVLLRLVPTDKRMTGATGGSALLLRPQLHLAQQPSSVLLATLGRILFVKDRLPKPLVPQPTSPQWLRNVRVQVRVRLRSTPLAACAYPCADGDLLEVYLLH